MLTRTQTALFARIYAGDLTRDSLATIDSMRAIIWKLKAELVDEAMVMY